MQIFVVARSYEYFVEICILGFIDRFIDSPFMLQIAIDSLHLCEPSREYIYATLVAGFHLTTNVISPGAEMKDIFQGHQITNLN